MNDFEIFESYWKETTDAIFYRINSSEGIMLTREGACKLWSEEVSKRFFSHEIIHGATTFLNNLKENSPETGAKVEALLLKVPPLGVENDEIAKSGATAAIGAVGMLASNLGKGGSKTLRALGTIVGAGVTLLGAARAAKQVNTNGPSKLSKEVARFSSEYLEEFKAAFNTAE